jgi:predicted GIY-YIG superfamily endonuclease
VANAHVFGPARVTADRREDCTGQGMRGIGKRFVYIVRSDVDPNRHYVGVTSDVGNRLEWHNHGPCGHTAERRPWSLVVIIEFPTEQQALRFERYLKSGSGRAFATRHFGSGTSVCRA